MSGCGGAGRRPQTRETRATVDTWAGQGSWVEGTRVGLGGRARRPLPELLPSPQAHRRSGRPTTVLGGWLCGGGPWAEQHHSGAGGAGSARSGGVGSALAAGRGTCLTPRGAGATPSVPARPAREAHPLQNVDPAVSWASLRPRGLAAPAAPPGPAAHGSRPWSLATQAPLPSHDSAVAAASPLPARCPRRPSRPARCCQPPGIG